MSNKGRPPTYDPNVVEIKAKVAFKCLVLCGKTFCHISSLNVNSEDLVLIGHKPPSLQSFIVW